MRTFSDDGKILDVASLNGNMFILKATTTGSIELLRCRASLHGNPQTNKGDRTCASTNADENAIMSDDRDITSQVLSIPIKDMYNPICLAACFKNLCLYVGCIKPNTISQVSVNCEMKVKKETKWTHDKELKELAGSDIISISVTNGDVLAMNNCCLFIFDAQGTMKTRLELEENYAKLQHAIAWTEGRYALCCEDIDSNKMLVRLRSTRENDRTQAEDDNNVEDIPLAHKQSAALGIVEQKLREEMNFFIRLRPRDKPESSDIARAHRSTHSANIAVKDDVYIALADSTNNQILFFRFWKHETLEVQKLDHDYELQIPVQNCENEVPSFHLWYDEQKDILLVVSDVLQIAVYNNFRSANPA